MDELTIKLTEKMVLDRQHCNEDSDCSECSCWMANGECLFNFTEERKVGKWVKYNTTDKYDYMGDRVTVSNYQCSECGRMIYDIGDAPLTNKLKDYPFCHCGADMRGAKNE